MQAATALWLVRVGAAMVLATTVLFALRRHK